jgi:hypothetical protein
VRAAGTALGEGGAQGRGGVLLSLLRITAAAAAAAAAADQQLCCSTWLVTTASSKLPAAVDHNTNIMCWHWTIGQQPQVVCCRLCDAGCAGLNTCVCAVVSCICIAAAAAAGAC